MSSILLIIDEWVILISAQKCKIIKISDFMNAAADRASVKNLANFNFQQKQSSTKF